MGPLLLIGYVFLNAYLPGGFEISKEINKGGVKKCCEMKDKAATQHSMFMNQTSMVVRI